MWVHKRLYIQTLCRLTLVFFSQGSISQDPLNKFDNLKDHDNQRVCCKSDYLIKLI